MNELQIFNNPEFGEIRAIEINDEPWFVGNDVAKALGYANPYNAVERHVETEDTLKQGVVDSNGKTQQTKVINESGVYSLIILSEIPSAKKFKRWVTSEVLPSLRKHGTYSIQPLTTAEQLVAQAQLLLNMETKLNAVTERMDSTETLLLDVGAKAEEAVSKLDTAIKVYSRPDKDHWQSDMAESIKGIVAVNGWPEPKFRGKLYKELEDTVGHTNINTRLKRLRDRKRGTGATYRESMAFTKLDAIAASKELRLIFEGIVKKYQAQLTGGK